MEQAAQFSAIASNQKVDAKLGIIYGVSVISKGEAVTHGVWIDDETISQIVELGKASGNDGIKVKMKHEGKDPNSPLISIVGALKNFRKDGEHARADLHYLTSDDTFDKAMEMAVKQPKDFGLSISSKKFDTVAIDGKDHFRIKSLESVDLTSDPAANANGLFSKKEDGEKMEYEADGKTHKSICMCKDCSGKKMSEKNKSKSMSKLFAKALGLAEDATDETIALELTKKLEAGKPTDLTELNKKVEAVTGQLAELEKQKGAAMELAKKGEIAALVAEAGRDGKVIPLSDVQLAKMDVTDIKEMITKLPKGQVALQKKKSNVPVDKEGKEIQLDRRTPEGAAALAAFISERKHAGAVQLGQFIRQQTESAQLAN